MGWQPGYCQGPDWGPIRGQAELAPLCRVRGARVGSFLCAFTLSYLVPVFGRAHFVADGLIGGKRPAAFIESGSRPSYGPGAERIVALGSVLLPLLALLWLPSMEAILYHPVIL